MGEILEFNSLETELAIFEKDYSEVPDATNDDGYNECKKKAKKVASLRNAIEKKRKELKKPLLDRCRELDGKVSQLQERVALIEEPLKVAYQAEDKKRKEAKERRINSIKSRIEGMREFVNISRSNQTSSEMISDFIEQVTDIDCTQDFDEFTKEALTVRGEVLEQLQSFFVERCQYESDQEELKKLRESAKKQEQENIVEETTISKFKDEEEKKTERLEVFKQQGRSENAAEQARKNMNEDIKYFFDRFGVQCDEGTISLLVESFFIGEIRNLKVYF